MNACCGSYDDGELRSSTIDCVDGGDRRDRAVGGVDAGRVDSGSLNVLGECDREGDGVTGLCGTVDVVGDGGDSRSEGIDPDRKRCTWIGFISGYVYKKSQYTYCLFAGKSTCNGCINISSVRRFDSKIFFYLLGCC